MLVPCPQRITHQGSRFARPDRIRLHVDGDAPVTERDRLAFVDDALEVAGIVVAEDGLPLQVRLAADTRPEGYRLALTEKQWTLAAVDAAGIFYGLQTLLQLLAFNRQIECQEIEDWPRYAYRGFMVDMGRATWPLPYLKRVVRILSRLKLNTLHLHLYDDHLCSLRFQNLPCGQENPYAITVRELGELVIYAARRHVTIVPELEAWGHAGSIIQHFPALRGAPGMYEGTSFAVGEELYRLMSTMLDEVVPVLPVEAVVHLGLDEAGWQLLPSAPADYTPARHVARMHEILMQTGRRHNRRLQMRCWADHKGIDIPAELRRQIIIEPWQYFGRAADDIRAKVARHSGTDKQPFIMGAGNSSLHLQGTFDATRLWCQAAQDSPNVLGPNICLWESNNLPGQLVGLYGGAGYAWNPQWRTGDLGGEDWRGLVSVRMKRWQSFFADAEDSALRADRGAEVYRGCYVDGALAGKPVTPWSFLQKASLPAGDPR
ncbi:MAG: hypothetical protein PCFJNLEI_01389 [Verrucomicrobiae bacterium]|nr:hypothetical protein [Verrucomicrobiae bacterium]